MSKIKIVIFSNCQGVGLKKILDYCLNSNKYHIQHLLNNDRNGNMLELNQTFDLIKKADLLVYQPLSDKHDKLSSKYLTSEVISSKTETISFAYFFNSGISSLGYAPMADKNKYGEIYGEEIIIKSLKKNGYKKTINNYKRQKIDFNLQERFHASLNELKSRELHVDIKLAAFIEDSFRDNYCFVTHNHPTTFVYEEIYSQLAKLSGIPINSDRLKSIQTINIGDLPYTGFPISPYDAKTHNYKFGYHSDWFAKGVHLIDIVYKSHILGGKKIDPQVFQTKIIFPDKKRGMIFKRN